MQQPETSHLESDNSEPIDHVHCPADSAAEDMHGHTNSRQTNTWLPADSPWRAWLLAAMLVGMSAWAGAFVSHAVHDATTIMVGDRVHVRDDKPVLAVRTEAGLREYISSDEAARLKMKKSGEVFEEAEVSHVEIESIESCANDVRYYRVRMFDLTRPLREGWMDSSWLPHK